MRILTKSLKGEDVRAINHFLGLSGNMFTEETKNAVIEFQKANGLESDGIVGVFTFKKMQEEGFEGEQKSKKESLQLNFSEIWDIVEANNGKLICAPNFYNKSATSFDPSKNLIVIAIRGFKLDTLGERGKNDRRIYDDAHFIITPRGVYAFDGNTDPNGFRKGYGTGSNKGMACLKTGVWFFGRGLHKGRPAFRQACPFTVTRDGNPPYDDTGYHAINWHDGGVSSTSSLGCQTNRPKDFEVLRTLVYRELVVCENPKMFLDSKDSKAPAFPYILIEETERRKGNLIV